MIARADTTSADGCGGLESHHCIWGAYLSRVLNRGAACLLPVPPLGNHYDLHAYNDNDLLFSA